GSGTVYLNTDSLLSWGSANLNLSTQNHGVATVLGGLDLGSGVSLTNASGSTLLVGWRGILSGQGTLVNQAGGTVVAGAALWPPNFTIAVPFTNEGKVEVENGSLTIAGGSSSSGH